MSDKETETNINPTKSVEISQSAETNKVPLKKSKKKEEKAAKELRQSMEREEKLRLEEEAFRKIQEEEKRIAQQRLEEGIRNEDVLRSSGILEAYEEVLKNLCRHGLPSGRIYEYAAQQIQKWERKKIARQLRVKAELEIRRVSKKKEVEKSKSKEKIKPVLL